MIAKHQGGVFLLQKKWYTCPHCGKRLAAYVGKAQSRGIYIKCKQCKREIEIKIST
nr:MAG TPA: zinc-ribbon domain protein [Caudoviricetes sp.]